MIPPPFLLLYLQIFGVTYFHLFHLPFFFHCSPSAYVTTPLLFFTSTDKYSTCDPSVSTYAYSTSISYNPSATTFSSFHLHHLHLIHHPLLPPYRRLEVSTTREAPEVNATAACRLQGDLTRVSVGVRGAPRPRDTQPLIFFFSDLKTDKIW